jgi:hypothetical protein
VRRILDLVSRNVASATSRVGAQSLTLLAGAS